MAREEEASDGSFLSAREAVARLWCTKQDHQERIHPSTHFDECWPTASMLLNSLCASNLFRTRPLLSLQRVDQEKSRSSLSIRNSLLLRMLDVARKALSVVKHVIRPEVS